MHIGSFLLSEIGQDRMWGWPETHTYIDTHYVHTLYTYRHCLCLLYTVYIDTLCIRNFWQEIHQFTHTHSHTHIYIYIYIYIYIPIHCKQCIYIRFWPTLIACNVHTAPSYRQQILFRHDPIRAVRHNVCMMKVFIRTNLTMRLYVETSQYVCMLKRHNTFVC